MEFDAEAFKAYFRKHKIASAKVVDEYVTAHNQELYHYEDIDAVYQMQVERSISQRDVHSHSELLPHSKHYYAKAGGGVCTKSGMKGGDQR